MASSRRYTVSNPTLGNMLASSGGVTPRMRDLNWRGDSLYNFINPDRIRLGRQRAAQLQDEGDIRIALAGGGARAMGAGIENVMGAILQHQDRKREQEDRDRDERDRELINREREARMTEAERVAARQEREDLRAADLEALASVTGLTRDQQRVLAHGQLEGTPWVPAVDEAGQFSIEQGETIPAQSPSRPDLVRMGEGYGLPVRSVASGKDPVLTPARTFEDINRFDIERAEAADRVAREAAKLTADYRTLQEKHRADADAATAKYRAETDAATAKFRADSLAAKQNPSETRLSSLEASGTDLVAAAYTNNALRMGGPIPMGSSSDLNEIKNNLRQTGLSEPRIEAVMARGKQKATQDQYDMNAEEWVVANTNQANVIAGMPEPVPSAEERATMWQKSAESIDPTPSLPEDGEGKVAEPNLREIVEDAVQPGGWGSREIEDQVVDFEDAFNLSRENAIALFEEVDKAVEDIRKSVELEPPPSSGLFGRSPTPRTPMAGRDWGASRPPVSSQSTEHRPGESLFEYESRKDQERELERLRATVTVDEANALLLNDAVGKYFARKRLLDWKK